MNNDNKAENAYVKSISFSKSTRNSFDNALPGTLISEDGLLYKRTSSGWNEVGSDTISITTITEWPVDDIGVLTNDGDGNLSWGSGGITNSAAANEIMKSDGTNAVSSGLESTTAGNLSMGLATTTGVTRTGSAQGAEADINLIWASKADGSATLRNGNNNSSFIANSTLTSMQSIGQIAITALSGSATISQFTMTGGTTLSVSASSTNTIISNLKLTRTTTGTPAAGIGGRLEFATLTATPGNIEVGGSIGVTFTDVTSTAEYADMIFRTMSAGNPADERLRITSVGNIYATTGATDMTNGFFYIPSAAGVPSGTPTVISGRVPMYYDSSNDDFYVYSGGAWKAVTLA